jgi:hypothetical protein
MIALRAEISEMAQRYPPLGMPVAILFGRSD